MNSDGGRERRVSGCLSVLWPPVAGASALVAVQALWEHSFGPAAAAGVVFMLAVGVRVREVRRDGQTVRAAIAGRRAAGRNRLDSAEKLLASAPGAAGLGAVLASCAAAQLALAAAKSPAVLLPARAGAWWELGIVVLAVAVTIVVIDYWLGPGTTVRTLAADRVTAALAAVSIAMAAMPAALALARAGSRPAWLALIVAELGWGFGGGITGAVLAANRKSRLPGAPPRLKPSLWLIDEGIRGDCDVVLRSAGPNKLLVIRAMCVLTSLSYPEAGKLVDAAPGCVLYQVTAARAAKAKELLERAGAAVDVR